MTKLLIKEFSKNVPLHEKITKKGMIEQMFGKMFKTEKRKTKIEKGRFKTMQRKMKK